MADHKKVAIIGSGNWGSAIAKIIGENVVKFDKFENRVPIYVFEEIVDGKKLTEIINTTHENVKYLPGHKLPENVVAVPDIVETCTDADILVFVFPHQFLKGTLSPLIGKLKPGAVGISLIKGFDLLPGGGLRLISEAITDLLDGIDVSVLMGANIANEVAEGKLCETTIGSKDLQVGKMLKELMQADDFRVVVVDDVKTVEICGALKNIVACAAGFIDGLGYGGNTKAAVIRLGLMEMIKYTEEFYPGCKMSTFFESCGVADLITTCYGGRNRKVSEKFAQSGKSIGELEAEMLNGQKLQGPETAKEVNVMLKNKGLEERFPLFTAVHFICEGQKPVSAILDSIRSHPEHLSGVLRK